MGPFAKCQKCGKACVFRELFTQKCVERVCFWVVWPTQKGWFQILIYAHATTLFAGVAPPGVDQQFIYFAELPLNVVPPKPPANKFCPPLKKHPLT